MKIKEAKAIAGCDIGTPSKMPGFSYGTPAEACITGAKLANVPGSVCFKCYALKGNYVWPDVQNGMAKRLASINHPEWIEALVRLIARKQGTAHRNRSNGEVRDSGYFRWHDSGDIQSAQHLENIAEIARRLPNVKFWLPTREYSIVKAWKAQGYSEPENLVIRLSAHKIDGPLPTALAEELGVHTSGVHTPDSKPQGNAKECDAYTRDDHCGPCRACWAKSVPAVSYREH